MTQQRIYIVTNTTGLTRTSFVLANVRSQATDAALSRQVACNDGLGIGGSEG